MKRKLALVTSSLLIIIYLPIAAIASNAKQKVNVSSTASLIRKKILSGELSSAIQLTEAELKNNPKNSELYFLKGRALQEQKRDTDALNNYSIAIFLNKLDAKAWVNRGLVKGSLRDLTSAMDDFNEAIIIDPQNAYAWLNRGVTRAGLNQPDQAIRDIDQAIRIKPSYGDAYRNRGIIKSFIGKHKEACEDWAKSAGYGDVEVQTWHKRQCQAKLTIPLEQGRQQVRKN